MDFDHVDQGACLPHDGEQESLSDPADADLPSDVLEFVGLGDGSDESSAFATFLNNILVQRAGAPTSAIVRTLDPGDSILINKVTTNYANNLDLEFRAPIVLGAEGSLRIMGDQPEVLRNGKVNKASLAQNVAAGTNVLYLTALGSATKMWAQDFAIGDKIIIRGQNDAYGKALTKQTVHVAAKDEILNTITLVEELEQGYNTVYPASLWTPDLTTGTVISVSAYAALTVNAVANEATIRVNRTQIEASGIVAGSVVLMSTSETESDINFNAHSTTPSMVSADNETIGTGSKTFTRASGSAASDFAVGQFVRAANSIRTGDTVNGSGVISNIVTTGLTVGMGVSGTGIPSNTTIAIVGGSSITLTKNATATGTGVALTFAGLGYLMQGVITAISGNDVTINVTQVVGSGSYTSWLLERPYRNAARLELKKVLSITVVDAGNSDVKFDTPLVDSYTVAKYGGITLYNPVVGTKYRRLRLSYSTDQLSRNTHGLQIGYAYKCAAVDCEVDGRGGQRGNGIRLSNSLECDAVDCRVSNPKWNTSGEGYGISVYYSDRCAVIRGYTESCRHNVLLQKANHTRIISHHSVNHLISGIDIHGVRSFNTQIISPKCIGGPGAADAQHKSAIRIGNTSHACGDYGTLIENPFISNLIVGNLLIDGVLTVQGDSALEFYGRSQDIVMRGGLIMDCNKGLRVGYDNNRATEPDPIVQSIIEQNTWVRIGTLLDAADGVVSFLSSGGITEVDGPTGLITANTLMPIDPTAPTITDGTEVMSTVYTAKQPNRRIKVTFQVPHIHMLGTSQAVVFAMFVGSTLIRPFSVRVTSGGTPPDGAMFVGTYLASGAAQTISVRFGPETSSTASLNFGTKEWSGFSRPFLIIEEPI